MVTNKLKHILIFLVFQAFFLALSHGKTVKDVRIKMLDGDYARLSDFNTDGPMIINFWTTW